MKFMNSLAYLLPLAMASAGIINEAHAQTRDRRDGVWQIRQDRWTPDDETKFSKFVAALGESGCNTIGKCLVSNANPYKAQNPAWISKAYSDCADLPYVLRMYFAYMNDLPFSYQSSMSPRGNSKDIRYSPNGNSIKARRVMKSRESLKTTMTEMRNTVSTAMFRVPPETDATAGSQLFPDFYPVKLDRLQISAGTNIYDPNGHVAIVYRVEADGRIRYMDAHPDNSITRGVYGEKFIRTRPSSGAGFKNWRSTRLGDGIITGIPNAQSKGFSLEQFYGNRDAVSDPAQWKKGRFFKGEQPYDYYDYVRVMLAEGNLRYEPLAEFQNMLEALCSDVHERTTAVEVALIAGVQKKAHPARLPFNIYGTEGEWETYSSPSRDARLKASFRETRKRLEQFVHLVKTKSDRIHYSGTVAELKTALLKIYDHQASECRILYKNSNGVQRSLKLSDIEERLWDLSFSPYHCAELRWGARGQELASCADSSEKLKWFQAQQRLRNQIERNYEVRMDFTADELLRNPPGSGVDEPPTIDLRGYLL